MITIAVPLCLFGTALKTAESRFVSLAPEARSLAAGRAAKKYVRELLTGKKFTVFTLWTSALGSSKLPSYYAIIEVDGRGLADLLVENGFARLHGTSVNHPSGKKASDYIATSRRWTRPQSQGRQARDGVVGVVKSGLGDEMHHADVLLSG
jgi:hypothetical protein